VPRGAHRINGSDVATVRRIGFRDPLCQLQQNGSMTIAPAPPIEQRLLGMAAAIRRLIPAVEVRLFGSRARGEAGPDSDIDLLITAPDAWLASRDRFALLADLWGAVAQPDLSVDLVLHSSSEAARRVQQPGSFVQEAIREGVLLDVLP
jgi:predicted nucleotidyltransferase